MNCSRTTTTAGVTLFAVGCTLALFGPTALTQNAEAQTAGTVATPTAGSSTAPSESGSSPQVLILPGSLAPDESVELYAKASGYIAEVAVDIGSRVRKGDLLVRLDVPEMQDELRQSEATAEARRAKVEAIKAKAEQARLMIESAIAGRKRVEANLELSRITHRRKSELYQEKAIPQQEFDVAANELAVSEADLAIQRASVENARGAELAARADIRLAEAELAAAEAETVRLRNLLNYTRVIAPFDGVITRRQVDPGDFVRSAAQASGAPLLMLEKTDRLRVVIDVPESQAGLVRPGGTAKVLLRSNGETPLAAKIARTAASLRSDTRTMRAEIDLENPQGMHLPGMFARVTIELPTVNR